LASDSAPAGLPLNLIQSMERKEIPALNGLRAIAVLCVVLYHAGLPAPGGFGVLVFFVLSGFLITWLLLKEFQKTGDLSFRKFYARRSLRIFPAFYAYSAFLLGALIVTHKHIVVPQAVASLLYLNDYYQAILGDPNTGLSHTWSLAVEEQFYLIWAPALLVLLRSRKVLPTLVTAIGTLWVYRLILVLCGVNQGYIYEAFDTRADHLLTGCLLAFLLFERKWARLFRVACRPWFICAVVIVLAVMNAGEFRFGTLYRDTVAFTIEPMLLAILIPGLIYSSATLAGRILESALISGMGRISYSMYLYQQIVISPVEKLLHAQPVLLQAVASVAATVVAALFSYHVIERPFLRLKSRFQSVQTGPVLDRNVKLADSR
jgi:peptidoglycan/LPS O-acetylase OafA/YrhL